MPDVTDILKQNPKVRSVVGTFLKVVLKKDTCMTTHTRIYTQLNSSYNMSTTLTIQTQQNTKSGLILIKWIGNSLRS